MIYPGLCALVLRLYLRKFASLTHTVPDNWQKIISNKRILDQKNLDQVQGAETTFQNIVKQQPSKKYNAQFTTYEERVIGKEIVLMI